MAWWRGRYVQLLERENQRLLEENKKLLGTILPRLGYDPLEQPEKVKPKPAKRRFSMQQWAVAQMKKANLIPTVFADLPRPDRKEHNGVADKPAANA
jgi:hypothetical protein